MFYNLCLIRLNRKVPIPNQIRTVQFWSSTELMWNYFGIQFLLLYLPFLHPYIIGKQLRLFIFQTPTISEYPTQQEMYYFVICTKWNRIIYSILLRIYQFYKLFWPVFFGSRKKYVVIVQIQTPTLFPRQNAFENTGESCQHENVWSYVELVLAYFLKTWKEKTCSKLASWI